MALFDFTAAGLAPLEPMIGPIPLIPLNAAQRTPVENFLWNEATFFANQILNDPNSQSILERHQQYSMGAPFYKMWFASNQTQTIFRDAARHIVRKWRDGTAGAGDVYNALDLKSYCETSVPQNFFPGYNDITGSEGFAIFALENAAEEAAASAARKCKDIVLYRAGAAFVQYRLWEPFFGPSHGSRETSSAGHWIFAAAVLWGFSKTLLMIYESSQQTKSLAQLWERWIVNFVTERVPIEPVTGNQGRHFWAWDWGRDPQFQGPNGDQRSIANMNVLGTGLEILARGDRYFKKIGSPDARLWPAVLLALNWLEHADAPGFPGSAGAVGPPSGLDSMFIPANNGQAQGHGAGWGYYYYPNGIYGDNGAFFVTTPDLNGHNLSGLAWGYGQHPSATERAAYRSRINEAIQGTMTYVGGGHFFDARQYSEGVHSLQQAFGLIEEADGGPPPPVEQDMEVTPLNPAINATVTVVITGGPGNPRDWVAIAPVGTPLTTYLDWKYLANNSQSFPVGGVTAGTVTLTAPSASGPYEVRFLANDDFVLVAGFAPQLITVGGTGPGFQAVLTLNGSVESFYSVDLSVAPQDEYNVRWFVDDAPYPVPIAGPLTKGSGQRFFKDANGRARFLTGSHNWNSVSEWGLAPGNPANPPPAFDWSAFLTRLLDEGHTATRLWLLGDFVGASSAWARVLFPWARSSTPGSINGGNKYDLNTFDATYFARLRDRVVEATSSGITCIIVFFNGWDDQFGTGQNIWHASENITIDGDPNHNGQTEEVYNLITQPAGMLAIQKAYIHKVIDTLNDLDLIVWEPNNEPGGWADGWTANIVADIRTYEASKPKQHPILVSYYQGTGTNAQLWAQNVEAVAPGPLAAAGTSPDGSTDYTDDPPASSGTKVVISDTDHIYGVNGDEKDVWRNFCRAISTIYMDPLIDQEPFPLPWNGNPAAPHYQRARDAMGLTAQMRERLRTDLNSMVPQAQGTAVPCNTGYCLYAPVLFAPSDDPFEGFAEGVTGGAGQPTIHVTNLNNAGAGSLREALSASNRSIVFDVSGIITLSSQLNVSGLSNITVDGRTSATGVTIKARGITFTGGAANIILRDLRFEDMGTTGTDIFAFQGGAHDILLDHCSGINRIFNPVGGAYIETCDGTFDVKDGAFNITAQWCLFGGSKQSLLGTSDVETGTRRITVAKCAYIGVIDNGNHPDGGAVNGGTTDRSPLCRLPGQTITDTILDFRYNIVANAIRANATKFESNTWANCVGNAYIPAPATTTGQRQGCLTRSASGVRLFASGNVELGTPSLSPFDINAVSNEGTALAAPAITPVTILDVFNRVGPRFTRSALEQERLDLIAPFSPFT